MIPQTMPDLARALEGLTPAIANHLWQSTLFALLAAALALALRRNQARTRHWIWMAASLKFMVPLAVLVAIGSHFAKPRAAATPQPVAYVAMEDVSEPFALPAAPIASPIAPKIARLDTRQLAILICGAAWLAGVLAVLGIWCVRFRRVAAAMREAVPVHKGREFDALRRLERAACVRTPIELRLSAAAMEPGIFGITRPVLAWPAGISQRLSDAQLDAVLAHEICHVRRRDNLTAAIHMLVEATFWFHPLVWWMGARLVEERERACDEEVLTLCRRPEVYAESILKVCEFCVESPLACVSGVTGADLKKRIVQIMTERVVRKLDLGRKVLLVAVGLAVIAVPIVLGQVKAAQRMAALIAAPASSLHTLADAMQGTSQHMAPAQELPDSASALSQIAPTEKPLTFDVVSIRPPKPGNGGGLQFAPEGLHVWSMSPSVLVSFAYPTQFVQDLIQGMPDWARTQMFDIEAKVADSDAPEWVKLTRDMTAAGQARRAAMLQALLADEFKLAVHRETREGTIYALVVAKGGPKLKETAADGMPSLIGRPRGHLVVKGGSIGAIVPFFAQELSHPVVDKTGLAGKYDFALDWTPDRGASAAAPAQESDSPASSIFTAVQEQLGLKLVAQRGPVEYFVVDHIEKPELNGAEAAPTAGLMPVALVQGAVGTPGSNATTVVPMAADAHPSFAVAAIKPHDPNSNHQGFNATGDRFIIRNEGIVSLMMFAYSIDKHQLAGLPDWVDNASYDIEGTTDTPGEPSLRQQQEMVRELLADRFQLKFHPEKRDVPVYAIQVAKGGPKLPPPANPDAQPNQDAKNHGAEVTVNVTSASVADFIMGMHFFLDRPLVDQTGLTGRYDFSVRYTYNDAYSTEPNAPPGIATAFQEQLGLKLESTKAPVDVLVIDHVEKPSEN